MLPNKCTSDTKKHCEQLIHQTDGTAEEALVVFTTGTSSLQPKGVRLSHDNLVSHLSMLREHVPYDLLNEKDTSMPILPWYQCYGLMGECFSMMDRQARMVSLPNGYSPLVFFQYIQYYQPTVLFVVPKVIERILEKDRVLRPILPLKYRRQCWFGPRMRYLVSGGASLDPDLLEECKKHLAIDVYQGYGCSEMSPMISLQTSPSALDSGKILPGVEVSFSSTNEVLVKGRNRFMGYMGEEELPPGAVYATGDTGYMKEGLLYITGRLKNIVKLSNGRFVNLELTEEHIKKTIHGVEQICIWEDRGALTGVVYGRNIDNNAIRQLSQVDLWFLREPLTVERGEYTLKGEPRRAVIKERYRVDLKT
jgi:long-chain acyl-CoA synthetase